MARVRNRQGERATEHAISISEARARLSNCSREEYESYVRLFKNDSRKGIVAALAQAEKRLGELDAERARVTAMLRFEAELAQGRGEGAIVGLDEVGRGPLAGPLTVGAVVLNPQDPILWVNDSKQLSPEKRDALAAEIKRRSRAWATASVPPKDIDALGMTAALKRAFLEAIKAIEGQGFRVGTVLLDGNPLHLDPREVNVVKGDAKCASIAAASIVAKVERDGYMVSLDKDYPEYSFAQNKGYASQAHIDAIRSYGLSPVHRVSFCTAFTQETLF